MVSITVDSSFVGHLLNCVDIIDFRIVGARHVSKLARYSHRSLLKFPMNLAHTYTVCVTQN